MRPLRNSGGSCHRSHNSDPFRFLPCSSLPLFFFFSLPEQAYRLSLQDWDSQPRCSPCPRGTLGQCGAALLVPVTAGEGCCWHWAGSGQGCGQTAYRKRDEPPPPRTQSSRCQQGWHRSSPASSRGRELEMVPNRKCYPPKARKRPGMEQREPWSRRPASSPALPFGT